MDATWIIPAVVVIGPLMERLGHRRDVRAKVPDSEILTIAVVAAGYVGRHHERAAPMMREFGYLSGRIGVSRFHRRLHPLADGMTRIPDVLGEVFTTGDGFIIESLPLPVCRRVRARRGRKARGREFCGYCAAKREKVFGRRVHPVRRLQQAHPGACRCCPQGCTTCPQSMNRRMACPPGRGGWAITPTIAPPMRTASRRRRGCARFRCVGRPCVRTPGVWTPSKCARIVVASR